MNKYKAVIFDLDGTLLDTIEDIADSCNELLAKSRQRPYPASKIKLFVGLGVDWLLASLVDGRKLKVENKPKFKAEYLAIYRSRMFNKTKPYPKIDELLQELKSAGVLLAVLSNKPDEDVNKMICHYFPTCHFHFVMGKRPEFAIKPDPVSVNHIIASLGLQHEEVLYVGDTKTDMETATNANLISVGVSWGFRSRRELLDAGANHIAATPADILKLVKGNCS